MLLFWEYLVEVIGDEPFMRCLPVFPEKHQRVGVKHISADPFAEDAEPVLVNCKCVCHFGGYLLVIHSLSLAGSTTSRLHLSQHVPLATGMALLPHSSFVLPQITHLILCPGVFIEQYLLSWLFQDVL